MQPVGSTLPFFLYLYYAFNTCIKLLDTSPDTYKVPYITFQTYPFINHSLFTFDSDMYKVWCIF